jgi:hypothetical protein
VSLKCERCDIRGGEDLSFMWFGKDFDVVRKTDGSRRKRTLWLCPDCATELGSDKRRTTFLRELLNG